MLYWLSLQAADLSAEVAQLVEHVTENHGVGSSILPLGTTSPHLAQTGRSSRVVMNGVSSLVAAGALLLFFRERTAA